VLRGTSDVKGNSMSCQLDVSKKGYVKSDGASLAWVKEQMGHSSIRKFWYVLPPLGR
jgi:hypothetical protein